MDWRGVGILFFLVTIASLSSSTRAAQIPQQLPTSGLTSGIACDMTVIIAGGEKKSTEKAPHCTNGIHAMMTTADFVTSACFPASFFKDSLCIRRAKYMCNSSTAAIASTVQIECASESIIVHISTEGNTDFHGLVYPRGLSKNSSCLQEYRSQATPITYNLPLRSCNTMPTELDDGGIEYFNTIVVQPHLKLVTNQGRGFHVRCRYQTRDKVVTNDQTHVAMLQSLPLQATAPMPGCTMKIFNGDPTRHQVAENVKIGDPLTLVISIDKQEMFGLMISDCLVRDGLGWGEQRLINDEGCPVDGEIMGQFTYSKDKTEARVDFQAHKFPYTASVYYQCNVRLCIKHSGGCISTPPDCNAITRRRRRDTASNQEIKGVEGLDNGTPATIEVYSGLYVNEASDVGSKADYSDDVFRERTIDDPNSICISQRSFAIGIAIAGLILMLAVVAVILILLAKRRHKSISTTGSSIYSGPYTNTAYSHSS